MVVLSTVSITNGMSQVIRGVPMGRRYGRGRREYDHPITGEERVACPSGSRDDGSPDALVSGIRIAV